MQKLADQALDRDRSHPPSLRSTRPAPVMTRHARWPSAQKPRSAMRAPNSGNARRCAPPRCRRLRREPARRRVRASRRAGRNFAVSARCPGRLQRRRPTSTKAGSSTAAPGRHHACAANATISSPLTWVRTEPLAVPKRSPTGATTERVDTRVVGRSTGLKTLVSRCGSGSIDVSRWRRYSGDGERECQSMSDLSAKRDCLEPAMCHRLTLHTPFRKGSLGRRFLLRLIRAGFSIVILHRHPL